MEHQCNDYSGVADHCEVPTCTAAGITALGMDYSPNDQTIEYSYDDLNRLTAAEYDSGLYYHYSYDAVGNRLTQETVAETLSITYNYTYDDANRLAMVNGQTYTFDENGNLLSDGEYSYTYNSANRLVGVSVGETTVSRRLG